MCFVSHLIIQVFRFNIHKPTVIMEKTIKLTLCGAALLAAGGFVMISDYLPLQLAKYSVSLLMLVAGIFSILFSKIWPEIAS